MQMMQSNTAANTCIVTPRTLLRQYLDNHKIVIVGGNKNFVNNLLAVYPDIIPVDTPQIKTCNQTIAGADYVFFRSRSMSHKLYTKVKAVCRSKGVPFGYLVPQTAITFIENGLCRSLGLYDGANQQRGDTRWDTQKMSS